MRKKPLLAIAFLALGLGTAFAQSPQTRADLMPRQPGGASDFVSSVQSNPARIIATPNYGIGPSGSGYQDSFCRQYPGFAVAGASQGYCDFRATSVSTGNCECGTYTYIQHHTVNLGGRSSYEEVLTGCPVCPPPIETGTGGCVGEGGSVGGGNCFGTGSGSEGSNGNATGVGGGN